MQLDLLLICIGKDHTQTVRLPASRLLTAKEIKDLILLRLILRPKVDGTWLYQGCGSVAQLAKSREHLYWSMLWTLFQLFEHLILVVVLWLLSLCEKSPYFYQFLENCRSKAKMHLVVKLGLDLNFRGHVSKKELQHGI